jgi:hypothetical protein
MLVIRMAEDVIRVAIDSKLLGFSAARQFRLLISPLAGGAGPRRQNLFA